MPLSKKATIIIPLNHKIERTSDHYRQTISILKKEYFVIAYHHYQEPIKLYRILNKKNRSLNFIKNIKNKNLFHIKPIYILPFSRFSFIKKINEHFSLLFLYFFSFLARDKKTKTILWIATPIFSWIADFYKKLFPKKIFVYYDCLDYLTSNNKKIEQELRNGDQKLLKITDLITVNNKALLDLYKKERKDVHLVPSGFRKKDFSKIKKKLNIKPIVGFIGTINNRINFKLLYQICKTNSETNFRIIGPIYKNEEGSLVYEEIKKLKSLENVEIKKFIPAKEIGKEISSWKIGIIPYDTKSLMNRYCQPLKIMEFFYFGIPIISTELPIMKNYPKYIFIAKNLKDWGYRIKELKKGSYNKKELEKMKKIAISNSWSNKIKESIKLINTKIK